MRGAPVEVGVDWWVKVKVVAFYPSWIAASTMK